MIGFDWSSAAPVFSVLQAEIQELHEALESGDPGRVADELGDVLFSAISLARHHGLDAEQVCRQSTTKFMERIRHVQALADRDDIQLPGASDAELEALWTRAKQSQRSTF